MTSCSSRARARLATLMTSLDSPVGSHGRRLRPQRLEVGKSLDIPITDSGRVFRMSVSVVERKRIDTVLGRVNTFRVEPAMFALDETMAAAALL